MFSTVGSRSVFAVSTRVPLASDKPAALTSTSRSISSGRSSAVQAATQPPRLLPTSVQRGQRLASASPTARAIAGTAKPSSDAGARPAALARLALVRLERRRPHARHAVELERVLAQEDDRLEGTQPESQH